MKEKYKGETILYRIIDGKTWYFTFLWSTFTGWYDSPLFKTKDELKDFIDETQPLDD
jgi:hypothetical protein